MKKSDTFLVHHSKLTRYVCLLFGNDRYKGCMKGTGHSERVSQSPKATQKEATPVLDIIEVTH
jgi:hypothetical protein